MKVTVITDNKGEIIGFTSGPATGILPGFGRELPEGGLLAGPGQELKEIEVPEEIVGITEFPKLSERLKQYMKQRK